MRLQAVYEAEQQVQLDSLGDHIGDALVQRRCKESSQRRDGGLAHLVRDLEVAAHVRHDGDLVADVFQGLQAVQVARYHPRYTERREGTQGIVFVTYYCLFAISGLVPRTQETRAAYVL